jgi:hypothetical protein
MKIPLLTKQDTAENRLASAYGFPIEHSCPFNYPGAADASR